MMVWLLQVLLCTKRRRRNLLYFSLFLSFFFLMSIRNLGEHYRLCPKPKQNLMYLKMIKCASETLSSLFRRYAYTRNLSIVLPVDNRIYLGWPYKMDHTSYRPSKTGNFNFLVDHAVYDADFFSDLMPMDTVFVTSLREPYAQFKSMFQYYKLALNSNMSFVIMDQVTEYLQNIRKYEAIYKAPKKDSKRFCIPDHFSMSQNLMAFNLGFAAGKPDGAMDATNNQESIMYFLASLESELKLVMIVEYFDESMVLLRRLMCWDTKDVLYSKKNVGRFVELPRNEEKSDVEKANIQIYKAWSSADYQLYEHFLGLFWRKVSDEGSSFYTELKYYRKTNKLVNDFCKSLETGVVVSSKKITIANSNYGKSFIVDIKYCKLLNSTLLEEVKKYYDKQPGHVQKVVPKNYYC